MLFINTLLGLTAIISTFAAAKPAHIGRDVRRLDKGSEKRQVVDGEDLETEAATDPLRDGK